VVAREHGQSGQTRPLDPFLTDTVEGECGVLVAAVLQQARMAEVSNAGLVVHSSAGHMRRLGALQWRRTW
jgi:hypothetical protein